jgi:hypothetical protein
MPSQHNTNHMHYSTFDGRFVECFSIFFKFNWNEENIELDMRG